jgi:hypothetical protein
MAKKTFHVCDGCGNYLDPKTAHHLRIAIKGASTFNSFEDAVTTGEEMSHREICRACAERLVENFHLNSKTAHALTDAVFGTSAEPPFPPTSRA